VSGEVVWLQESSEIIESEVIDSRGHVLTCLTVYHNLIPVPAQGANAEAGK